MATQHKIPADGPSTAWVELVSDIFILGIILVALLIWGRRAGYVLGGILSTRRYW